MKKIVLLFVLIFSLNTNHGQNLSLYLENYDADTTNLLVPEVFGLPCSNYYLSYRGHDRFLTAGLDSLFAIAQPYNTDSSITLDGIVIYSDYMHFSSDSLSIYHCNPTSLYCEILDSNKQSVYRIRYDTINQNAPESYVKHNYARTFFALNFDTLINIKRGRFYVTITFGDNYSCWGVPKLMSISVVDDFHCDTSEFDYPLPLLQFENDTSWYETTYAGTRFPYMPVYPRLNTTGYISGSSNIENVDNEEITVDVFPNPTNSEVNINCGYKIKSIQIFDEQGKMLSEKEVNTYNYQLNLDNYPTGTYLIKVQTNSGQTTKKVIKE